MCPDERPDQKCVFYFHISNLSVNTWHFSSILLFWTGTVPGSAGGGAGERGLGEVDPAGCPDTGRAGQRARSSATQPLQTPARDPDRTNVQHQL